MYLKRDIQQSNVVIGNAVSTATSNIPHEEHSPSPTPDANQASVVPEVKSEAESFMTAHNTEEPVVASSVATEETTKVNDSPESEKDKQIAEIPRPDALVSSGAMAKQLGFSEEGFYAWLVKHDVLKKSNERYLLTETVASGFYATDIVYTFMHPSGESGLEHMLMWTSAGIDFLSALYNLDKKNGGADERHTQ